MNVGGGFTGFPREGLDFLYDLAMNNETAWFNDHKPEYERSVLEPSRRFVTAMGPALESIAPQVVADPRVNKSLFRINRDIRFSSDKSPYKTHAAIWFWEGSRPRMENSGFYVHIEPYRLMVGVGIYRFPKPLLERFRRAAADETKGAELRTAIATVSERGPYHIGGEHYKRVPRGFDSGHPNADLLKFNGLYAGEDTGIPDELFTEDFVPWCMERFTGMLPLHAWLHEILEG